MAHTTIPAASKLMSKHRLEEAYTVSSHALHAAAAFRRYAQEEMKTSRDGKLHE